jgi:hypothetical protein
VTKSSVIPEQATFFLALGRWPREFLSLGSAGKKTQKRPSGIAKIGDFSGVFYEWSYSGGEEWI